MATSLSSLWAMALLSQSLPPPVAPTPPPPPAAQESLALLRARLARDTSDGRAWLAVGRLYLQLAEGAHAGEHRALQDSVWTRAVLDTAEHALARAVRRLAGAAPVSQVDSARVLRVAAWSARSRLAWEEGGVGGVGGVAAGPEDWGPPPADLKLPPVLDELGENLLRACPMGSVLLTAHEADTYAAWFMQFARGLRPDLLIVALAAWHSDAVLRARLAHDLKLGRASRGEAWLAELARRRPVCASMGFEQPPDARPRVSWATRPLVWVAGRRANDARVPPSDFVFAALRMALDDGDAWAQPALALYARAARATPALCEAFRTFDLTREITTCRRKR